MKYFFALETVSQKSGNSRKGKICSPGCRLTNSGWLVKDNALMSTPLLSRNSIIWMHTKSVGTEIRALCIVLLCVNKAPEAMSISTTGFARLAAQSRGVCPYLLIKFGSAPCSRNYLVNGIDFVAELKERGRSAPLKLFHDKVEYLLERRNILKWILCPIHGPERPETLL